MMRRCAYFLKLLHSALNGNSEFGKGTYRRKKGGWLPIFLTMAALTLPVGTPMHANAGTTSSKGPKVKTRMRYIAINQDAWQTINNSADCKPTPTVACKERVILQVTSTCTEFAQFYRKESAAWSAVGFGLVLASAAFTGVGASTTIANAKVYSTLGGTTGLGAVTSTAKSSSTNDLAGVTAVYAELGKFQAFLNSNKGTDTATYQTILEQGPVFAANCIMATPSTTGTANAPQKPAVPDAPTGVTAAPGAGPGQATITFTAPNDEGAAITKYTATSSPDGKTGTETSSPITVSGLTSGRQYTFTVKATNSAGDSKPSGPSSQVTSP